MIILSEAADAIGIYNSEPDIRAQTPKSRISLFPPVSIWIN